MWLYTWVAFNSTDPLPLCGEQSIGALHVHWFVVLKKPCCGLRAPTGAECWLAKVRRQGFVNHSLSNTSAFNDASNGELMGCRCLSFLYLHTLYGNTDTDLVTKMPYKVTNTCQNLHQEVPP